MDQRQVLLGGVRVALLDRRQNASYVTHGFNSIARTDHLHLAIVYSTPIRRQPWNVMKVLDQSLRDPWTGGGSIADA
jgi:hypothetical protein